MNLKRLIGRKKIQGEVRGKRRRDTPAGLYTAREMAERAEAAGHAITKHTLLRLARQDTLDSSPDCNTIRGVAAGIDEPVPVVATATLVSLNLAPGWLTLLVERAVQLVQAGGTPHELLDVVDELVKARDTVVAFPTVAISEAAASYGRQAALAHVANHRQSTAKTMPVARSSSD